MIRRLLVCAMLFSCVGMGSTALGQAAADVPEPLKPWVPWVLHGSEEALCPVVAGAARCQWPSELRLSLAADGGTFALDVFSEVAGDIPLPGGDSRFPQQVTLDGRAAVVLSGPRVHVQAGRHRLEGRFLWAALPESLPTPAAVGRLKLIVDGTEVPYPRRDASGLLWLQSTVVDERDEQRFELLVSRRIDDGVPVRITTRLDIAVGGKARELVLPAILLQGTTPVELISKVPARLEADGTLRVQVTAGQHQVDIVAVAPSPPAALTMPKLPEPWPTQEIWVFAANPTLRQVELSGAPQIDPARTSLAPDFRGLSTYVLAAGKALSFETRRRGAAAPPPNELRVDRTMWLDLDGGAFTVRDQLSGEFHRDFRLSLTQGDLGRFSEQGQDQLITRLGDTAGVELQTSNLSATAEWRLPFSGAEVPAVAWSEDAAHLSTTLHLPPGYALLDVTGADSVGGTLLSAWDLWDFFFVLLVALATAKLVGKAYFPVALSALGLSHHLYGAPFLVFLWLLVALALSRLPLRGVSQTLTRLFFWGALAAVLIGTVPFLAGELRSALYPQLSSAQGNGQGSSTPDWMLGGASAPRDLADAMPEEAAMEEEADMAPSAPKLMAKRRASTLGLSGSASSDAGYKQDRYGVEDGSGGAAVQTGPGVPTWDHDAYYVRFSGPVQQGQTLDLHILSPLVNRGLSVLRVALMGLFLFGLLRRSGSSPSASNTALPAGPAAATAFSLLLCLSLPDAQVAHAQDEPLLDLPPDSPVSPPPPILSELKRRLLEQPKCAPDCVSVSRLQIQVQGREITMTAEVHAGALGAYRVPGPLSVWAPRDVRVDGKADGGSARLSADGLYLRVTPGSHRVEMRGPLQDASGLQLQLGSSPHRVEVTAPEFEVDGVRADGTASDTIQLRRHVKSDSPAQTSTSLPPFVEVTRTLNLGVNFRVETVVRRLGSSDTSLVVRFPLLEQEAENDAHVDVAEGVALVHFAAGVSEVAFLSTLTPRSALLLKAPEADAEHPWTVNWEIACSPLYHCESAGLTPISRSAAGQVLERFEPYPGEQLSLALTRLPAAEGASSTIDTASLAWRPGARLTQATLALSMRSSGGATSRVELPEGARISETQVDGRPVATRNQDGAVEFPIPPGNHSVQLEFQVATGLDTFFTSPVVRVDGALVNVEVVVTVPQSRWLLWADGPQWGPAVLFWGYLLAAVLFALALSRVARSPLTVTQWILLSLGLTQVPVPAALTVVAWFFIMEARGRWVPPGHWRFNFIQLALIGLTLSAGGVLVAAVHEGLVVQPDMQVAGSGSGNDILRWYLDRVQGALPEVTVVSVPLWIYKGLMLAWALWLAASALSFLRFGWEAFSEGGRFRPLRRPRPVGGKPAVADGEFQHGGAELVGGVSPEPPSND